MQDSKKVLESELGTHFKGDQRRLLVLTRLILGILHLGSVSYSKLSKVLNPLVKRSSNFKRIQRFIKGFSFDRGVYIQFVWGLFVKKNNWVIMSMDRTNWKFGKSNINILLIGISYKGTAIPLVWKLLNKRGNSNTEERIELIESLKSYLKEDQINQIRCLLTDREFIGKEWISYLKRQSFTFVTRIRANTLVRKLGKHKEVGARLLFQEEYFKALRKQRMIWGYQLFIAGQKLGDKDYLILVSSQPLAQGKKFYGERWGIEVFFAACKTRGFNFEDTHVTKPDRIFNLLFLIAK
ncbi:MAG: IS4 family transposase [Aureispira sp.]